MWDATFDPRDGAGYRSFMNEMEGTTVEVAPGAEAGASGASLFTLLDVAERLRQRVHEELSQVGLSYPKYEVLKHLRDAKDAVNLGCLADEQRCARSNITQLVDRLEVEGLVRRVPDPVDRRCIRAELTELGLTGANDGDARMKIVLDEFASSFSNVERTQLGQLLERLV